MRFPAAPTFAALLLFTTFVVGQTVQTPQKPQGPQGSGAPQSSETPKASEQPQGAATPQNPAEKPQAGELETNPFDAQQQFSAAVSGGPLHWDKMKIYRSGNKFRADYAYENEIRISNLSKRDLSFIRPKDWVKQPKECGTMKMMDISSYPFFAYMSSDFKVERAPADGEEKETIDGHSCKIENYTVKNKDGVTLISKVKMWKAEDLNGFPLRIELEPSKGRKTTLYYSDVSLEKPDSKLFEVPANCPKPGKKAGSVPSSKSKSSQPATPKANNKGDSPPQ
jgi:hypothetical protein